MFRLSTAAAIAVAVIVAVPPAASAQRSSPADKAPRTLVLPSSLLVFEGSLANGTGAIFTVQSDRGPDGAIRLEQDPNWITKGFPLMAHMKLEKQSLKKDFMELEFRQAKPSIQNTVGAVKVRVPKSSNPAEYMNALTVPGAPDGSEAQAYLVRAYEAISAAVFTEFLADIPADRKHALLTFAHVTAEGTGVAAARHKGEPYLAVNLGSHPSMYNDLRFNQASMVAHVFNERLLKLMKAFAAPVADLPGIHGIKLTLRIPHKDFTQTMAPAKHYLLEVLAPSATIAKFAEADITSQQLVNESVVLVDDNRIEVPLAAGAGTVP